MYRTQAQRIWSAEARAKVLYFFNNFSFETEEYLDTRACSSLPLKPRHEAAVTDGAKAPQLQPWTTIEVRSP